MMVEKFETDVTFVKFPCYYVLVSNFVLAWLVIQFLEMHDPYVT